MGVKTRLATIAENVPKVYESGKKSQYDEFWDSFQENGNRNIYSHGFNGGGWTQETLNPKYLVKPIDTSSTSQCGVQMFYRANEKSATYLDFSKVADKFDFSGLTMASSMFDSCKITNIIADFSNAENLSLAFAARWYASVDKATIKVSEKLTTVTNMFYYNRNLTELILMEGSTIACSGWDLKWASKLTKASIESIINALSSTTSGLSITLSQTAKNNAFTTSEWESLVATKNNWTISLVTA
jgi:hypothetical protein